jgi:hypothetical protein
MNEAYWPLVFHCDRHVLFAQQNHHCLVEEVETPCIHGVPSHLVEETFEAIRSKRAVSR